MKAVMIENDRSLSWRDVPDPIIKSGEVLVKVEAAALNRADLLQRAGDYPPPPGCPEWMGLEIAGTIAEVGEDVKAEGKWQVGNKVCALLGGGGYAEYAAVPVLRRKAEKRRYASDAGGRQRTCKRGHSDCEGIRGARDYDGHQR